MVTQEATLMLSLRWYKRLQQERDYMPLTKKGLKIRAAMEKFYGKKQGDSVFYASENKGNITGVTKKKKKK